MKALKVIGILVALNVVVVIVFESFLALAQPAGGDTVTLTTLDESGTSHDRVVSLLEVDGAEYVAANHWPRAWYRQALENPEITVTSDGETRSVTAVPVEGDEFDRVNSAAPLSIVLKVITGYPPRRLLRLDAS